MPSFPNSHIFSIIHSLFIIRKALASWVKLYNRTSEVFPVEMGIDFRGGDRFVAEHFLDSPEISSTFHEMGGKRVTEGMRTDGFL